MLMSLANFLQFADDFQPSFGVTGIPALLVPGKTAEQMLTANSIARDCVLHNPKRSPIAKVNPIAIRLAKAKSAVCLFVFKAPGTYCGDGTSACLLACVIRKHAV